MGQTETVCCCSAGIEHDRFIPAISFTANVPHPAEATTEKDPNDGQNERPDDPTDPSLWLVPFWSPREASPPTLPLPGAGYTVPSQSGVRKITSSEDAASTATPPPAFNTRNWSHCSSPLSPTSAEAASPYKAGLPRLPLRAAGSREIVGSPERSRKFPSTLGKAITQSPNQMSSGEIENARGDSDKCNDPLDPALFNTVNTCQQRDSLHNTRV